MVSKILISFKTKPDLNPYPNTDSNPDPDLDLDLNPNPKLTLTLALTLNLSLTLTLTLTLFLTLTLILTLIQSLNLSLTDYFLSSPKVLSPKNHCCINSLKHCEKSCPKILPNIYIGTLL